MQHTEDIHKRLHLVEISLKRTRLINILLMCICSCMLFYGFIGKDKILLIDNIEADNIAVNNIDIVDKSGKRRMKIGMSADQKISIISIFGKESGIPAILLNSDLTGTNSAIAFFDSQSKPKYTVKVENDTNCYTFQYDKNGKVSGGYFNIGGISSIYTSRIHITDSANVNRTVIALDEKDNYNPYIIFADSKSKIRSKWNYSSTGPSGFALFNEKQQNHGFFGVLPNGKTFVTLFDSLGNKQILLPDK
ncbi:MAG: hypothetical protein ACOYND_03570 [Bacteroidota bacterium]